MSPAPVTPATGSLSLNGHLMAAIAADVRSRGLRQQEAATLAALKQPELSRIVNMRDSGFSTDRLIDVLCRLGHNVEIVVTKGRSTTGRLHVTVPAANQSR
ncbi:MAG: helix-turn-helix domain-containing protein [Vulcanimicrobiaceae bacterium]